MRIAKKTWFFLILGGLAAVTVAYFEWNWLRVPLAHYVSARVGRPVSIDGDLHVELSRQPLVSAERVTVSNAAWSAEPLMARAQRVTLRIEPLSLLWGPVSLPEVMLVAPEVLLERSDDQHANWQFPGRSDLPVVGVLGIENGVVRFVHRAAGTDVTVNVESSAGADSGPTPVHFSGSGRLRNQRFTVEGDAASLLALESQEKPYALNVRAHAGDTSAHFDGTIVPARMDNVDGSLTLQGRDLSQLYPIIPVPFPWTPPYRLRGQLKHADEAWTYHGLAGNIGDSDIAGDFAVGRSGERVRVDADLVSKRLDYKDLGGLVGLPPADGVPALRTAAQNEEAAKRERSGRVLPAKPYDLERLRAIDAQVRFRGKRFMASSLPLDAMDAKLDLKDGVLRLQPLEFGIAGGHVASTVVLDARGKLIKTSGDVTARNVELKQILPAVRPPNGSAGKVGGRARFSATGNSIADMLASSNGEVALISRGGEASALAVVLTNLDLVRAVPLLLKGDENSPIRCVVADFVAENGTLTARTLVMDTEAEKITGEGSVDFGKERYDLTLKAQSKKPSIVALRGPILVDGSFKSPSVHPAVGPVAARVGTSVALGVALTPVAALLPLIDFGGSGDADCRALMQDAKENVEAQDAGPARGKPAARRPG